MPRASAEVDDAAIITARRSAPEDFMAEGNLLSTEARGRALAESQNRREPEPRCTGPATQSEIRARQASTSNRRGFFTDHRRASDRLTSPIAYRDGGEPARLVGS